VTHAKEDMTGFQPVLPSNYKQMNPLFYFLLKKMKKLVYSPIELVETQGEAPYLKILLGDLLATHILFPDQPVHQHFRIDPDFIELPDHTTKKGRAFSHHTTWYGKIVVHVYFNSLGNILYVEAKNNGVKFQLTPEEEQRAIVNALNTYPTVREYINQLYEAYHALEEQMQSLHDQLKACRKKQDKLRILQELQDTRNEMQAYTTFPLKPSEDEQRLLAKLTAPEPEPIELKAKTKPPSIKARDTPTPDPYADLKALLHTFNSLNLQKPDDVITARELATQITVFQDIPDKKLKQQIQTVVQNCNDVASWTTCMYHGDSTHLEKLLTSTEDFNLFGIFKSIFGHTTLFVKIPSFTPIFIKNCNYLYEKQLDIYMIFLNFLTSLRSRDSDKTYLAYLFEKNEIAGFEMLVHQGVRCLGVGEINVRHYTSLLRLIIGNTRYLNILLNEPDIFPDLQIELNALVYQKTSNQKQTILVPSNDEIYLSDLFARVRYSATEPIPEKLVHYSNLRSLSLVLAYLTNISGIVFGFMFCTYTAGIACDLKPKLSISKLQMALSSVAEDLGEGPNIALGILTTNPDLFTNIQAVLNTFNDKWRSMQHAERIALINQLLSEAETASNLSNKYLYYLACEMIICTENPMSAESSFLFLDSQLKYILAIKHQQLSLEKQVASTRLSGKEPSSELLVEMSNLQTRYKNAESQREIFRENISNQRTLKAPADGVGFFISAPTQPLSIEVEPAAIEPAAEYTVMQQPETAPL